MCHTTHPTHLCTHRGYIAHIPCPSTPNCAGVTHTRSTLPYCCHPRCCGFETARAKEAFVAALLKYEAFKPSDWDWITKRTKLREEKAELKKVLVQAREVRDRVEERHAGCWGALTVEREGRREVEREVRAKVKWERMVEEGQEAELERMLAKGSMVDSREVDSRETAVEVVGFGDEDESEGSSRKGRLVFTQGERESKVEVEEDDDANEGGMAGVVVFPRGAKCSKRPKGKGKARSYREVGWR